MERGSILIITLIAVLILSFMVASGIRTATTEIHTAQNYYLNKIAYYNAVDAVNNLTVQIRNSGDPTAISLDESQWMEEKVQRNVYTGTLENGKENVRLFQGFTPPPLPGVSLGTGIGIIPVIWQMEVVSHATQAGKESFSEIEAGVYGIMPGY